jgi:hypothetical protein
MGWDKTSINDRYEELRFGWPLLKAQYTTKSVLEIVGGLLRVAN